MYEKIIKSCLCLPEFSFFPNIDSATDNIGSVDDVWCIKQIYLLSKDNKYIGVS